MHRPGAFCVVVGCSLITLVARAAEACIMHQLLGITEPTATWLSDAKTSLTLASDVNAAAISDPAITAWRINSTNAHGFSTDSTINSFVSSIKADVDTVAYNSSFVF